MESMHATNPGNRNSGASWLAPHRWRALVTRVRDGKFGPAGDDPSPRVGKAFCCEDPLTVQNKIRSPSEPNKNIPRSSKTWHAPGRLSPTAGPAHDRAEEKTRRIRVFLAWFEVPSGLSPAGIRSPSATALALHLHRPTADQGGHAKHQLERGVALVMG